MPILEGSLSSATARRLAITEDASNQPQNTLEARIQSASRFLLEQIALDARRISDVEFSRLVQVLATSCGALRLGANHSNQYFCTESTVRMHCMNCRHETFRTEASRSIDLFYKRWVSFFRIVIRTEQFLSASRMFSASLFPLFQKCS